MAKMTSKRDEFANIAYLSVAEINPGTLTFARLELATALMTEKQALIIHRAEFILAQGSGLLDADGQFVSAALTLTDRITDIADLSQPEILFYVEKSRRDLSTALGAAITYPDTTVEVPILRDFSSLPGGGLLVPADRLYIGVNSNHGANAGSVSCRLYYTVMSLAVDQYWELIEARRIMTT